MAGSDSKRLYKVIFNNQGKVYEIFARTIAQGNLFGFVEVEDLVFGEKSTVIVDPGEDALKTEFENTKRFYVPMHSIIRIDEVEKNSSTKPRVVPIDQGANGSAGNGGVTPIYTPGPAGN